jgi:hypothetical protein
LVKTLANPDAASGEPGHFWSMAKGARESVSPEVHELAWVDIGEVVHSFLTSKGRQLVPVNDFQKCEFDKYGIKRRDPMYASMQTVRLLEEVGSIEALRGLPRHFDVAKIEQARLAANTHTGKPGSAAHYQGAVSKL